VRNEIERVAGDSLQEEQVKKIVNRLKNNGTFLKQLRK